MILQRPPQRTLGADLDELFAAQLKQYPRWRAGSRRIFLADSTRLADSSTRLADSSRPVLGVIAVTKPRVDDQDELCLLDITIDAEGLLAALLGDSEVLCYAPTTYGWVVILLYLLRFSVQWEKAQSSVVMADLRCFAKWLGVPAMRLRCLSYSRTRLLPLRCLSFSRIRPPVGPNLEFWRFHGLHEFREEPGAAGNFSRADFHLVGLPFVSGAATAADFRLARDHPVRNTVTRDDNEALGRCGPGGGAIGLARHSLPPLDFCGTMHWSRKIKAWMLSRPAMADGPVKCRARITPSCTTDFFSSPGLLGRGQGVN